MSIPSERLDSTNLATLLHPCSQIKIKGDYFSIPEKYHELFLEFFDDVEHIPATQAKWTVLQAIYITSFWLDAWYSDGLPTPVTKFHPFDLKLKNIQVKNCYLRLTSVSTKTAQPYASLRAACIDIETSERCRASRDIMQRAFGRALPVLAVREWKDLTHGKEYRCVVFESEITCIVPHSERIGTLDKKTLANRCMRLLDRVRHNLPSVDCVMDVWIGDSDCVIEFNSFGVIGNSHSDHIDWRDPVIYSFSELNVKV